MNEVYPFNKTCEQIMNELWWNQVDTAVNKWTKTEQQFEQKNWSPGERKKLCGMIRAQLC